MYAATTAGPGAFAGARWVATRACKAVRPPGATWFGDPARGSFLTTVWLLDGTQAGVGRVGRAPDGDACAREADRMFAGRDHLHTAVYRFVGEARADGGVSAATALDHPFGGVVAIAVPAGDGRRRRARRSSAPSCRSSAVFAPERVILAEAEPPPHDLVLGVHARRSARRVARARRARARVAARRRVREPVRPYHPRHRRLRRRAVTDDA